MFIGITTFILSILAILKIWSIQITFYGAISALVLILIFTIAGIVLIYESHKSIIRKANKEK